MNDSARKAVGPIRSGPLSTIIVCIGVLLAAAGLLGLILVVPLWIPGLVLLSVGLVTAGWAAAFALRLDSRMARGWMIMATGWISVMTAIFVVIAFKIS